MIRPLTDRPELGKRGAVNFVVAPRPLENQRRKHQKTDRLDARALLDNLESYLRGKRDAMSKAWFPYFRLYAPTEDHFNRKWILPDFEKVQ